MAGRLLRIVIVVAVLAGLGGLGYWAWLEGREERKREETRELSIKVPPRRITDPTTQEVVIRLDAETQQRLGLAVEPVEHTRWEKRLKLLGFSLAADAKVVRHGAQSLLSEEYKESIQLMEERGPSKKAETGKSPEK